MYPVRQITTAALLAFLLVASGLPAADEPRSAQTLLDSMAQALGGREASAVLFYYRKNSNELEQVSVGADGQLWVMTGPADGNTRTTPVTARPNGSTIQLGFTHYNVEPDRFESKMEVTRDGGETWFQGNHQVLTRRKSTQDDA